MSLSIFKNKSKLLNLLHQKAFLKLFPVNSVQATMATFAVALASGNETPKDYTKQEESRPPEQELANDQFTGVNRRDVLDLANNFGELMKRYQQSVYNVAFQLLGDEDEAGDVTQETFISAYRARSSFRSESKVFTWLYRITINHSKNRLKSRSRIRSREAMSLDAGFDQSVTGAVNSDSAMNLLESAIVEDWSGSPAKLIEERELGQKINEAIDSLAPEYKSVLVLREIEQMSYNDIAETVGLSLEAVKTRISRARAMVRRRVGPYIQID
jgi:RNA polymerase sigma-70 factor (ECF subfamily)